MSSSGLMFSATVLAIDGLISCKRGMTLLRILLRLKVLFLFVESFLNWIFFAFKYSRISFLVIVRSGRKRFFSSLGIPVKPLNDAPRVMFKMIVSKLSSA